ncbi:MAG: hypothetical protein M3362_02240 [Acidobacteriota bacterium]|nr:hypothetical protein [Acidobacteriota bacterium]
MNRIAKLKCRLLLGLVMFTSTVCWAQKPELVVQVGHQDDVRIVGFAQDGKVLITQDVGSDGTVIVVKVWDAETGTLLRTISATNPVKLSPDKKILGAASVDGTIRVWDVATGQRLRVLRPEPGVAQANIQSIFFSPDSHSLAAQLDSSGGDNQTATSWIETWDIFGGETRVRQLKGEVPYDASLVFTNGGQVVLAEGQLSPDEKVFSSEVTPDKDYKNSFIEIRETGTNNLLTTIKNQSSALAFSPNNRILATMPVENQQYHVKLWDVYTGTEVQSLALKDSPAAVTFSPDGKLLAAAEGYSEHGLIELFDVSSGSLLQTLIPDHSVISIAFSPDGKSIAESHQLGSTLWDVATGQKIRDFNGYHERADIVSFSPDGKSLVIQKSFSGAEATPTFVVWELTTGREPRTFTGEFLAFSSDGRTIIAKEEVSGDDAKRSPQSDLGPNFQIKVIDLDIGTEQRTIQTTFPSNEVLGVSRDGDLVASGPPAGGKGGLLSIWNVKTGRLLKSLNGLTGGINFIRFSPDGSSLAAGGGDEKGILIWEVNSGRFVRRLLSGHHEVSAEFSPDGKTLASVSGFYGDADEEDEEMTVRVWRVATGSLLYTHKLSVSSLVPYVAFSPDGRFLAGSSMHIDVWSADSGAKLHTFEVDTTGAADLATSFFFSPDSKFLVSSMGYTKGYRTQVWDLSRGAELPFLKNQSEDAGDSGSRRNHKALGCEEGRSDGEPRD